MRACEMCGEPVKTRKAILCGRPCQIQYNRRKALERSAALRGGKDLARSYSDDIHAPHYWPKGLPDAALVDMAREMIDSDKFAARDIMAATGLSSNMIGHIRHDAWRYDTIIDDVALDRAMAGDVTVLPRLTMYERAELRERLVDRLRDEPVAWKDSWVAELAGFWGVDHDQLRNRLSLRLRRRTVAA